MIIQDFTKNLRYLLLKSCQLLICIDFSKICNLILAFIKS